MNSYNLIDKNHCDCVLYHVIAMSEEQVIELAEQSGIDLTDVIIELERSNVKDQLGRPYTARIEDARV